jgi:hypothetical protein
VEGIEGHLEKAQFSGAISSQIYVDMFLSTHAASVNAIAVYSREAGGVLRGENPWHECTGLFF